MDESLAKLEAAFTDWRSRKRHPREAVPVDLVRRACAAARRHGPAAVRSGDEGGSEPPQGRSEESQ